MGIGVATDTKFGGGIFNLSGTVGLTNSTVSGNKATIQGGGIYNGDTLNANFVTIYNNTAPSGPNLHMIGTKTTLYATIVAQGSGQGAASCYGRVSSTSAYNRVSGNDCGMPDGQNDESGAAIELDVNLAYNGGPTLNHLPTPNRGNAVWERGKLAILDQVPPELCGAADNVDQRGRLRPRRWSSDPLDSQGGYCDVGAVEYYQETRYVCSDPTNTAFGSGRKEYIL